MAGPTITPASSPRGWTINATIYAMNMLNGTALEYYGDTINSACQQYAVDPNFVYALLEAWQDSYRGYTTLEWKNPFAMLCVSTPVPAGQIACHELVGGAIVAEYDTLVNGIYDGIKWLDDAIKAGHNTWLSLANYFLYLTDTPTATLGQYVVALGDDNAFHYPYTSPVKITLPNPNPPPPKPPVGANVRPNTPTQQATNFAIFAGIALMVSAIIVLGLRKPERSE